MHPDKPRPLAVIDSLERLAVSISKTEEVFSLLHNRLGIVLEPHPPIACEPQRPRGPESDRLSSRIDDLTERVKTITDRIENTIQRLEI